MTIADRLNKVKTALTAIQGVTVYHYWAFGVAAPYIVYEEDDFSLLRADGEAKEIAISGYCHFFTKTENDPIVDNIISALNGLTTWSLNSVQFEDETNLIHYEFKWSVL